MSLHGFNLLQDNITPPDMWDQIYEWVNNVGRIIVIVVEIAVVVAFGIRIVIDTQTKNLTQELQKEEVFMQSLSNTEFEIRELQRKFKSYRVIWNQSSSYSQLLNEISASSPRNPDELTIGVSGDLVTIRGSAETSDIREFENTLKASSNFNNVRVDELETLGQVGRGQQDLADFSISIQADQEYISDRVQLGSVAGDQTGALPTGTSPTN